MKKRNSFVKVDSITFVLFVVVFVGISLSASVLVSVDGFVHNHVFFPKQLFSICDNDDAYRYGTNNDNNNDDEKMGNQLIPLNPLVKKNNIKIAASSALASSSSSSSCENTDQQHIITLSRNPKNETCNDDNGSTEFYIVIEYSHNFHRYVVWKTITSNDSSKGGNKSRQQQQEQKQRKQVLESFLWLDEAQIAYPDAYVDVPTTLVEAIDNENDYSGGTDDFPRNEAANMIAGAGTRTIHNNNNRVIKSDNIGKATTKILRNEKNGDEDDEITRSSTQQQQRYRNEAQVLTGSDGSSFLLKILRENYKILNDAKPSNRALSPEQAHQSIVSRFPYLQNYDARSIKERLQFFVAPQPPSDFDIMQFSSTYSEKYKSSSPSASRNKAVKTREDKQKKIMNNTCIGDEYYFNNIDWPLLFYEHGYGAGLHVHQVISAILMMPYLLSISLQDAGKSKHPQQLLPFFYYNFKRTFNFQEARSQLNHWIYNSSPCDVSTFTYLNSVLGISWDQCRILLQALPTLVTCDTEPSWEFFEKKQLVRSIFVSPVLDYLQLRLQLTPTQVYCLLKTHSRLSTYSLVDKLKPNLDALQNMIGLSSSELQLVIVRMPSLTGMAISTLEERIQFFVSEVGMTSYELKKSLLKFPALLQYSIGSNLIYKLSFFVNELQMENKSLVNLFVLYPSIWGLSLELTLKPRACNFVNKFNFTLSEVGDMLSRAPNLLNCNWEGNLAPKINFLIHRLVLSETEITSLIYSTPRILYQSIQNSLEHKINMLEELCCIEKDNIDQYNNDKKKVATFINEHPSLMIQSRAKFEQRILNQMKMKEKQKKKYLSFSSGGNSSSSSSSTNIPLLIDQRHFKRGKGRSVIKTIMNATNSIIHDNSNGTIISYDNNSNYSIRQNSTKFLSVKEAAIDAGSSVSNMYQILRAGGRKFGGYFYMYEEKQEGSIQKDKNIISGKKVGEIQTKIDPSLLPLPLPSLSALTIVDAGHKVELEFCKTIDTISNYNDDDVGDSHAQQRREMKKKMWKTLFQSTRENRSHGAEAGTSLSKSPSSSDFSHRLVVFVSSHTYPPDDHQQVRGRYRAGGMSIHIPGIATAATAGTASGKRNLMIFRQSCESCYKAHIMPNNYGDNDGSVSIGYHYVRPSRNRCSLYGCFAALQIVRRILRSLSFQNMDDKKVIDNNGEMIGNNVPSINTSTKHKIDSSAPFSTMAHQHELEKKKGERQEIAKQKDQDRCAKTDLLVDIVTDSNYALKMLTDPNQLIEWGSIAVSLRNVKDFVYNGPGPSYLANTDILYPLAGSYYHLIMQDLESLDFNVTVRFLKGNSESAKIGAANAAEWEYQRSLV